MPHAILVMSCPDQQGVIAAVSGRIHERGGNILRLEEHVEESRLFMRLSVESLHPADHLRDSLVPLMASLGAEWELHDPRRTPRLALLVTREAEFLHDFRLRQQKGLLEVPLVVGNRPDLQADAERLGLSFHHIPNQNQDQAEAAMLSLLQAHEVDLIVLAKYMKILSPQFINAYRHRIINIHHSFLPAFVGARPYHQAHLRGVKIVGATAHYATEELDAGPIISQDVIPVSHRDSEETMVEAGQEVERRVLWRAVKAHIEHRVMVSGNRTVVFGG